MLTPANCALFTLDIAGVEHDLRVLEFTAKEAISRLTGDAPIVELCQKPPGKTPWSAR